MKTCVLNGVYLEICATEDWMQCTMLSTSSRPPQLDGGEYFLFQPQNLVPAVNVFVEIEVSNFYSNLKTQQTKNKPSTLPLDPSRKCRAESPLNHPSSDTSRQRSYPQPHDFDLIAFTSEIMDFRAPLCLQFIKTYRAVPLMTRCTGVCPLFVFIVSSPTPLNIAICLSKFLV